MLDKVSSLAQLADVALEDTPCFEMRLSQLEVEARVVLDQRWAWRPPGRHRA